MFYFIFLKMNNEQINSSESPEYSLDSVWCLTTTMVKYRKKRGTQKFFTWIAYDKQKCKTESLI